MKQFDGVWRLLQLFGALFHVKHLRLLGPLEPMKSLRGRRRVWLLPALLFVIPVLVACDVADQPDGWAAPTPDPVEPETQLLAPTGDKTVVALRLLDGNFGAAAWQFPDDDGNFPGLDAEIEPEAFYADPVWIESTDEWLLAGYSDGVLYAVRRDGESARVVFESEARLVADLVVDGTPGLPGRHFIPGVRRGYRAARRASLDLERRLGAANLERSGAGRYGPGDGC